MKTIKKLLLSSIAALVCLGLTSCEDTTQNNQTKGQYVIAATVDDASYLLQTSSISEGEVSTIGNGAESTGIRSWMFYKNTAYNFLYAQGDAGQCTSFILNSEGLLEKRKDLALNVSITTRGYYDDYVILVNSTRSITDARGTFYFVDVVNQVTHDPIVVDTKELAGNDKVAYFTDIAQVGDKIYASYKCINGTGSGNANTMKVEIFDTLWIAVYNYNKTANTLTFEGKITDTGRTSFVAGQTSSQHETGISQVETGEVYVFSSAPIDDITNTNLPSGVLKINKGEQTFDKSYFFNIQALADNHHLYRVWHVSESIFALQMFTDANSTSSTKNKFAIVDVVNKTFNWVTGFPEATDITAISKPYVDSSDKTIAFGITTAEGSYIYTINTATYTASQGIKVIADEIAGIGKLTY